MQSQRPTNNVHPPSTNRDKADLILDRIYAQRHINAIKGHDPDYKGEWIWDEILEEKVYASYFYAIPIFYTALVHKTDIPISICEKFSFMKDHLFEYIMNYATEDGHKAAKNAEMLKKALHVTYDYYNNPIPQSHIGFVFWTARKNWIGGKGTCTSNSGVLAKITQAVADKKDIIQQAEREAGNRSIANLRKRKHITEQEWDVIYDSPRSPYLFSLRIYFAALVQGTNIPVSICRKFASMKDQLLDYMINYAIHDGYDNETITRMLTDAVKIRERYNADEDKVLRPLTSIARTFLEPRKNSWGWTGKCTLDTGVLAKINAEIKNREAKMITTTEAKVPESVNTKQQETIKEITAPQNKEPGSTSSTSQTMATTLPTSKIATKETPFQTKINVQQLILVSDPDTLDSNVSPPTTSEVKLRESVIVISGQRKTAMPVTPTAPKIQKVEVPRSTSSMMMVTKLISSWSGIWRKRSNSNYESAQELTEINHPKLAKLEISTLHNSSGSHSKG